MSAEAGAGRIEMQTVEAQTAGVLMGGARSQNMDTGCVLRRSGSAMCLNTPITLARTLTMSCMEGCVGVLKYVQYSVVKVLSVEKTPARQQLQARPLSRGTRWWFKTNLAKFCPNKQRNAWRIPLKSNWMQ
ncbi:hypothetical protein B0H17DRAFT_1125223 [Mycena rosella]|uniref:Uncharacterized protein n=1 Tax=Mycena rosella TaxID=1033263 RepID=A0AAD7M9V1_MYCRO|nr:hypothetical protein B0H17DRAFT_1125223 [Mycena rosella]